MSYLVRKKTAPLSDEPQEFKWKPHPAQWKIWVDPAHYKVVSAGRRFGKTELAWMTLLDRASNDTGLYWWVAPIYQELIPASQTIRKCTPVEYFTEADYQRSNVFRYLRLPNKSEIYFHSTSTEDSLRGSGLKGLVLDESASIPRARVEEELMMSLADYDGWLLAIGTPKGRQWFYEYFKRGQNIDWPRWKSWQFSSYYNTEEYNGYLKKSVIDDIARGLPELIRRQEIYANFLKGEGEVFQNIYGCLREDVKLGSPRLGESFVKGADLAKAVDFTCLTALNSEGAVRGFDRFKDLNWVTQKRRIRMFDAMYPGPWVMDTSGVGDPIYDDLTKTGDDGDALYIRGYKFTNQSKKILVDGLGMSFDQYRVKIPAVKRDNELIPEPRLKVMVDELEGFIYKITPSGLIRYEASEGMHDDTVVSLALANWGLFTGRMTGSPKAARGRRRR